MFHSLTHSLTCLYPLLPRLIRSEWASVDEEKRQQRQTALTEKLKEWQALVQKEMTTLNESSPAPRKRPPKTDFDDGRGSAPATGSNKSDKCASKPESNAPPKGELSAGESDEDLFDSRFRRRVQASGKEGAKREAADNESQRQDLCFSV